MKWSIAFVFLLLLGSCDEKPAQRASQNYGQPTLSAKEASNPYVPVDVSPMDMAYYPVDYPIKKMNDSAAALPVLRIIYSRPHRGGRKLFGELVKWGQPWRLGANEATEIEFFQPVSIQNQRIAKGRYALYAIPQEKKWTIVLSTNIYAWGLKFNPASDVGRFDVPVSKPPSTVEYFTISFSALPTGAEIIIAWEDTEARLPLQF